MKELGDWKFWVAVIVVVLVLTYALNRKKPDGSTYAKPINDFLTK